MEPLFAWMSRQGALAPRDAVGWAVRLARTVGALHEQGKVHGAISPWALLIENQDPRSRGELLTRPQLAPEYFSPERAATGQLSAADDVWGLALTLYVALTTYQPFEAEDPGEIHEKITSAAVPPLVAFGIVDEPLQKIIDIMLERELLDRVVAVEPFRRSLLNWARSPQMDALGALEISGPSLSAPPPAPSRSVPPPAPSRSVPPPAPSRSVPPPLAPSRPAPPAPSPSPALSASPASPAVAPPAPPRPRWPLLAGLGLVALVGGGVVLRPLLGAPQAPPPAPAVASTPTPPQASARASISVEATPTTSPPVVSGASALVAASAPPVGAATTGSAALAGAASGSAAPLASAPGSASAAASALAPARASASPPALSVNALPEVGAAAQCALVAFPADTFPGPPRALDGLCAEADPRRGATLLKDEVIRASISRKTSQAMNEWAVLSWYEMMVFAALRGRCCPGAPPIKLPEVKHCPALDQPLNEIAQAAASRRLSASAAAAPLRQFDEGLRCILRIGATGHYGRTRPPLGDGEEAIRTLLDRLK